MAQVSSAIVVTDTSVLVNFLRIDRTDLLGRHSRDYVVTDHVAAELTDHYPDQQTRYADAVAAGEVRELTVTAPDSVELFGRLSASGRIGAGECSAIALAVTRHLVLAIDDRRAIKEALRFERDLKILKTQDLMVSMIRESLLELHEADAIKKVWAERHRFRLSFGSFSELLRAE
jgi:predicted nucleic acid-binding protein